MNASDLNARRSVTAVLLGSPERIQLDERPVLLDAPVLPAVPRVADATEKCDGANRCHRGTVEHLAVLQHYLALGIHVGGHGSVHARVDEPVALFYGASGEESREAFASYASGSARRFFSDSWTTNSWS